MAARSSARDVCDPTNSASTAGRDGLVCDMDMLKLARHRHLVLALSMGVTLASCKKNSTQPSPPDKCADNTIAVTKKEREEVRAIIKAKVLKWEAEAGGEVVRAKELEITNSMDRVLDDWARMRQAVCYDHFKREMITAEEYQTRVDCLNAILAQQRTFLQSLESPQADASAQLAEINNSITDCLMSN